MSFKVGDRVRVDYSTTWRGEATVIAPADKTDFIRIRMDDTGETGGFTASNLELIVPRFVNVVTTRSIWVTLPGDNAGHKLTEDEARTLFRQLEEVV